MDYKTITLLLLSVGSILGSAFLSFRNSHRSFNTSILSVYLLILGLIFLETFTINYFGYENSNPLIVLYSYLFFVLCLALPPTFYLYVQSLVNKKEDIFSNKKVQQSYLPAVVLFIINVFSFVALYNIDANSQNYNMIQNVLMYCNFVSIFFIFLLQNIFYVSNSWSLYKKQKIILKESQSEESNLTLNWMRWFIVLFTILIASLYLFQLKPLFPGKFIFRIFTLLYVGVIIYYGSKNYKFLPKNPQSQELGDNKRAELKKVLLDYMEDNKPHLNQNLTLSVLATELNINSKYLSYIINKEFNCNFSTFINAYRVTEAKDYLSDPSKNIYTIESIAQMTGFKSKSAFNYAFKKETNLTPSKFKLQHLPNS